MAILALSLTLIPRTPFDPQTAIAMVCGPEIMMRFTVREFRSAASPRTGFSFPSSENEMCYGLLRSLPVRPDFSAKTVRCFATTA